MHSKQLLSKNFKTQGLAAQGAIEYLLIIGAAVIIAVIVIALMMSLSGQGTGAVEEAGVQTTYSELELFKISQQIGLAAGQGIIPSQERSLALNLESLWTPNEDYSDEHGEISGEQFGEVPLDTGLWDQDAYSFTGSNDNYIQIQKGGTRPRKESYSVWFKPTDYGVSIISFVVGLDGNGNNPEHGVHSRGGLWVRSNGQLFFFSGSYSGLEGAGGDYYCWEIWPYIQSEQKVILNNWNHAVVTIEFDNNYAVGMYLNGEFIGKNSPIQEPGFKSTTRGTKYSIDGSCGNDNVYVWLGRKKTSGSEFTSFKGLIGETAFWSRILSAQEAKNLFIKGAALIK